MPCGSEVDPLIPIDPIENRTLAAMELIRRHYLQAKHAQLDNAEFLRFFRCFGRLQPGRKLEGCKQKNVLRLLSSITI